MSIFQPDHKILMDLGKVLEKVYTMEVGEFNTFFSHDTKPNEGNQGINDDYHVY